MYYNYLKMAYVWLDHIPLHQEHANKERNRIGRYF